MERFFEISASWDYTGALPVKDTSFLTQRIPWYSLAQDDFIPADRETPVGKSDTTIYAMQHQVGLRQYELTNHLGNVQATVSDNPVKQWDGSGDWTHSMSAITAAYDYYPFGMLMPGRFTQDTSTKCLTVSKNKWMYAGANDCYDKNSSWPWFPGWSTGGGTVTITNGEPWLNHPGSYSSVIFPLPTGNEPVTVKRKVRVQTGNYTGYYQMYVFSDMMNFTDPLVLAPNSVHELPYDVEELYENFVLVIEGLSGYVGSLQIKEICFIEEVMELQTVLVDVCNDVEDRYPFGFNGQEKVNEMSGVGNHNTAEFWEYDTRVARRWNLDPVDQVSISNYAAFGLNPIYNVDVKGDVIRPWETKSSQKSYSFSGYKTNTKYFADVSNLESFNKSAIELAKTNDIFVKVYSQISRSSTEYKVEQSYSPTASYSNNTKTISMAYRGVEENAYIPKTEVFEEFFHAGQDDYYSGKGIKRSHLEDEVEAKVADIISGHQDDAVKKNYGSIKKYFKTGEKDREFNRELDDLTKDVYQLYSDYDNTENKKWTKENNPKKVDKNTVLNYLESITNVKSKNK